MLAVTIKKNCFVFVATAMVVPCMMTMASAFGTTAHKGTVMGIFRSLGALARAFGPIVASIGKKLISIFILYNLTFLTLLVNLIIHVSRFSIHIIILLLIAYCLLHYYTNHLWRGWTSMPFLLLIPNPDK